MQHPTITVAEWLDSPEYQTQRDAYFGVKLDCGHLPATPEGTIWAECKMPMTTGYGTAPDGRKLCFDCCAEDDKRRMVETGKGDAYLSERPTLGNKILVVTTWPGNILGDKVVIRNRWRDNFGGHRVAFRFMFNGEVWAGSGPGEGMYCRVKRTKLKSLW